MSSEYVQNIVARGGDPCLWAAILDTSICINGIGRDGLMGCPEPVPVPQDCYMPQPAAISPQCEQFVGCPMAGSPMYPVYPQPADCVALGAQAPFTSTDVMVGQSNQSRATATMAVSEMERQHQLAMMMAGQREAQAVGASQSHNAMAAGAGMNAANAMDFSCQQKMMAQAAGLSAAGAAATAGDQNNMAAFVDAAAGQSAALHQQQSFLAMDAQRQAAAAAMAAQQQQTISAAAQQSAATAGANAMAYQSAAVSACQQAQQADAAAACHLKLSDDSQARAMMSSAEAQRQQQLGLAELSAKEQWRQNHDYALQPPLSPVY